MNRGTSVEYQHPRDPSLSDELQPMSLLREAATLEVIMVVVGAVVSPVFLGGLVRRSLSFREILWVIASQNFMVNYW